MVSWSEKKTAAEQNKEQLAYSRAYKMAMSEKKNDKHIKGFEKR